MTLLLKTESHGIVEAGFYAAFMQFARLGEYTFATRHLCDVVQYFAENNNAKDAKIVGYDLATFWERSQDYHEKVIRTLLEQAQQSTLPALKEANLAKQLQKWQAEIPLEVGKDIYSKGRIIPLAVSEGEQSIEIGKYVIASPEFGGMAYYLAHGGFFGWSGKKPPFAEATMAALRNSDRKLYQEIRQELEASVKPKIDKNLN